MSRVLKRKSLIAYIFCCLFLGTCTYLSNKWTQNWSWNVISWDVSGYYLYLPSLFYDDLGKLHNHDYILNTYHPSGDYLEAYRSASGNYIMKYPAGMAVMYLPGFTVAHFWAKHSGYPVDGFSHPYQFCIAMEAIFIAFIGLWFMRKILDRYFDDHITALLLIVLCLGTNYLNLTTFSGSMAHNYLFMLYAIILYLSDEWHRKPSYKTSALLGLSCGMAALIRPSEVICVILPAFWLVYNIPSLKERLKTIRTQFPKVFVFSLCAVLIGSIQLIYWKIYSGHFLYWSYGDDQRFNFLRLHIAQLFFSYRKGWFVYTPVMTLSLIGFVSLYRYKREVFWSCFIFTLANLWIVTAWWCWWYGGSFSQRSVVHSYAVLAFPLGALFVFSFKRLLSAIPTAAFLLFCIWLNLLMTYQTNGPGCFMESDNMGKKYFWKIFGHTSINWDDRKFIETHDEVPENKVVNLHTIDKSLEMRGQADSILDGRNVYVMNKDKHFTPELRIAVKGNEKGWYRFNAEVYVDSWPDPSLGRPFIGAYIFDGDSVARKQSYRLERIVEPRRWQKICIDIETPPGPFDNARFSLGNSNGDRTILITNMSVEFAAKN